MPNKRLFEVSEELFNAAENELLLFFSDRECALGVIV